MNMWILYITVLIPYLKITVLVIHYSNYLVRKNNSRHNLTLKVHWTYFVHVKVSRQFKSSYNNYWSGYWLNLIKRVSKAIL